MEKIEVKEGGRTPVMARKAFRITRNKGFHLTFPNGVTLSTQFGWANYGDNYDKEDNPEEGAASNKVEIAIWDRNDKWITEEFNERGQGGVMGWLDQETWLKALEFARNYKPKASPR